MPFSFQTLEEVCMKARAGLGWAGLGRAGLDWAGLGRAGLGWAGLDLLFQHQAILLPFSKAQMVTTKAFCRSFSFFARSSFKSLSRVAVCFPLDKNFTAIHTP